MKIQASRGQMAGWKNPTPGGAPSRPNMARQVAYGFPVPDRLTETMPRTCQPEAAPDIQPHRRWPTPRIRPGCAGVRWAQAGALVAARTRRPRWNA